jgi:hypothetical protein
LCLLKSLQGVIWMMTRIKNFGPKGRSRLLKTGKTGNGDNQNDRGGKMNNKERMQAWRAEKTGQGGRNLSVWLDPETTEQLDALRTHFGRSKRGRNKPLISIAIRHLHESIFNK